MDTFLDWRGYGVVYNQLSGKKQKDHLDRLTFIPVQEYDCAPPKPVVLYTLGTNRMWMPKIYGIKHFGKPRVNNERTGTKADINFLGELKEQQQEIVDQVMPIIRSSGGGQLSLPTGFGKTVIAIYIASLLGEKVLWVTHQTNLLEQTKKSFEKFAGCRVGTIRGSVIDTDAPVVMGMLQSISQKTYDPKVFDQFGLVIFDEVHRVPSAIFSQSIAKVSTKYMIGLSATPKRKDGLDSVITTCIGPIIAQVDLQLKIPLVELVKVSYESDMVEHKNRSDKANIPAMVNDICVDAVRNKFIMDKLKSLCEEGRTMLVLTERRGHAVMLSTACNKAGLDAGVYLGQMKPEELAASNAKTIILGTYAMCSTGYDNPRLNTVVLATSKRDVRQTVGRILGLRSPGDVQPKIVDFVDTYGPFRTQAYSRKKYYRDQKFDII